MIKKLKLIVAGTFLMSCACSVMPIPAGAVPQATSLSAGDKNYLDTMAQANLAEIGSQSTVATHAGNIQSKQLAVKIKNDHTQANIKLKRLAAKLNYTLPASPSFSQQASLLKLKLLHGSTFDIEYKKDLIHDHSVNIGKTQTEIAAGHNPWVIANARQTLPVLKMHLKMAQALP